MEDYCIAALKKTRIFPAWAESADFPAFHAFMKCYTFLNRRVFPAELERIMSSIVFAAASAIIAALFIYHEYLEKPVHSVILKGIASLCFLITGMMNSNGSAAARMIVTGLALGFIADILLNLRFVFKKYAKPIFLTGILVFLAGHIAYLFAVFPECPWKLPVIILSVVLTAVLMTWIFSQITADKVFKLFGIVYVGAILTLTVTAIANLIHDRSTYHLVFMLGSVFFLISDVILILNTFGKKPKFSRRIVNLSMYYIGQLLIAFSLKFMQ